jgi:gamma-glutamyltranspeptidase / glutathione hydrolase
MSKAPAGSTIFRETDMPGLTWNLKPEYQAPPRFAEGSVATAFPQATEAAIEILEAGGNAVDAAVAAAWALSVCEPSGSGLGGQTILLVHLANGITRVVDGHSHAPATASPAVITAPQQRAGYRATTVPSTPATLNYAQRRYGRLPAARLMQPAIRLAEEGYPITSLQYRQGVWLAEKLRATSAGRLFLRDGNPLRIGEILRQPQLAATLRRLAARGTEDFYLGGIARLIAQDMQLNGGLITEADLAGLALPAEREPISIEYRGHRVVTVPPPGGGAQILVALRLIEQLAPSGFGDNEEEWYETIALACYGAFREREHCPLGPDGLTPFGANSYSEDRALQIADWLRSQRRVSNEEHRTEGPGDTTHLSVIDRDGNVVALTQSIQSLFGAKVAHPTLGFLYNNYLFTCPRYPHPYGLASGALPRSNAAPTLVFRSKASGGVPLLALGAAGSRRITSSIVQVLSSVIDRGMNVTSAVSAPRVHALLSGKIWIEKTAASPLLTARLQARFPKLEIRPPHDFKMGSVQAIQRLPSGRRLGTADPRRDGTAAMGTIQ